MKGKKKLKKEREELKASCPKVLLVSKKVSLLQCTKSLYTAPAKEKLQKKKNQNQKLLQGIKWEENQKGEQKSKIQTSSRNSVAGLKSEQCTGEVVSQPAKFYRLRKFATLQNSCSNPISLHFLLFFPSGF